MKIPNGFLIVGAAVFCLATFSASARDSEEDAKLRDAMRDKISEMSPEAAPAPTPAPKPAVKQTAPAKPAKPVEPAKTAAPAKAVPAKPVVPAKAQAPAKPAAAAPATTGNYQSDPLQEALHQRITQEESQLAKPAPVTESPTPAKTEVKQATSESKAPAKQAKASKPAGQVPLVPPPTPLSGSKEERLGQLLKQYKADQITPAEYHEQRAKIIAE